jgi:hypothetical protein
MRQKPQQTRIRKSKKANSQKSRQAKAQNHPISPHSWSVSEYREADHAQLVQLKSTEMALLSKAGQKALTVLMRSHLTQASIADELSQRHIAPAIREKLRAIAAANKKLSKDERVTGTSLADSLRAGAQNIEWNLAGPPALPSISPHKFRQNGAWPFFRPGLTYAAWQIYRRASVCKLSEKESIIAVDSVVHPSEKTVARTRQSLLRFRANKKRVWEVNALVRQLLSNN